MKNQWKGFLCGVIATLLMVGSIGTAMATVGKRAVEISYNNISVTLDGQPINLVDVSGNPVEPFMLDNTNYLPVRAVATALGLDVDWDGVNKVVILTTPKEPSQNIPGIPSTVYITPTGQRYHYDNNCNGGTYIPSTLEDALRRGLTPCNKCVK